MRPSSYCETNSLIRCCQMLKSFICFGLFMLTGTESCDTSIIILGVKLRGLLQKDRETSWPWEITNIWTRSWNLAPRSCKWVKFLRTCKWLATTPSSYKSPTRPHCVPRTLLGLSCTYQEEPKSMSFWAMSRLTYTVKKLSLFGRSREGRSSIRSPHPLPPVLPSVLWTLLL